MLKAKLNYHSGLRIGNINGCHTKRRSNSTEPKNVGGKKYYRDVLGSSLIKYRIFSGFCDICGIWGFLKFVIFGYFFSLSKWIFTCARNFEFVILYYFS